MIDDAETMAFYEIAKREAPFALLKQTGLLTVGDDAPLRPEVEQWLQGRVEIIRAGVERCPSWFAKTLKRFDPTLRVRWDFYQEHWVIERFNERTQLFHRVGVWARDLGDALIEELRKGDMWKSTTGEKIAAAEEQAEAQLKRNEAKTREGWLEAVDSLTRKKQEEFVEVSRAIEHGEDLQFMGPDADFMNKVWEEKQKQPDMPDTAINPGMKPGTYRRNVE